MKKRYGRSTFKFFWVLMIIISVCSCRGGNINTSVLATTIPSPTTASVLMATVKPASILTATSGPALIATITPAPTFTAKLASNPASQLNKITLNSKSLSKEMKINIYLPKGYSAASKYPVLYVLHGQGGNENSFLIDMGMEYSLDSLIESGKIAPLIVVAPQTDNSFGLNSSEIPQHIGTTPQYSYDAGMYEDYIYKELIPYIDSSYSTINSREGRYIGGISMGGFAALHIAFKHTDLFSKVGGHSPALFCENTYWGVYGFKDWIYPDESTRKERDPIYLAQYEDLSGLKIYLDCGSQDNNKFYLGCDELYKILKSKNYSAEYHLNSGAHNYAYWEANMDNYLLFYDAK